MTKKTADNVENTLVSSKGSSQKGLLIFGLNFGAEIAKKDGIIHAIVIIDQTIDGLMYFLYFNGLKIAIQRSIATTNMFVSEAEKKNVSIATYVVQSCPFRFDSCPVRKNGPTIDPTSISANAKLTRGILRRVRRRLLLKVTVMIIALTIVAIHSKGTVVDNNTTELTGRTAASTFPLSCIALFGPLVSIRTFAWYLSTDPLTSKS